MTRSYVATALLLAGCGNGVGNPPADDVPESVLRSCQTGAVFYNDAEIDGLYRAAELERERGRSYETLFDGTPDACVVRWGFATREYSACLTCLTAILEDVYNR